MRKTNEAYEEKIKEAIELLRGRRYDEAQLCIHEAIILNDNGVEAQNLIGAYYELIGDRLLALRHYRAAYALEPSYEYANLNIERLTYNNFIGTANAPLLGDESLSKLEKNNNMFEKMR